MEAKGLCDLDACMLEKITHEVRQTLAQPAAKGVVRKIVERLKMWRKLAV